MQEEKAIEILTGARLFRGIEREEIQRICNSARTQLRFYKKGSVVFLEGEQPKRLFILISGSVIICKNTMSGKRIVFTKIERPGEMFGEVYLFLGKDSYEVEAETLQDSYVFELEIDTSGKRRQMDELEVHLQRNLMHIFANKAYLLNNKVRILGSASIREKIAVYLMEFYKEDGKQLSREELADFLNVTRPSLSRELGNMCKEGILEISGRKIRILDPEALEDSL